MTTTRRIALAAVVAALLPLSACGGSDGTSEQTKPRPSTTETTEPTGPTGDDFCTTVDGNGGSGATFGPIPVFYPKDDLLAELDGAQGAMTAAEPPAEIAEAWKTRADQIATLTKAAGALPDGGMLDAEKYQETSEQKAASKALTDYWFAHCS